MKKIYINLIEDIDNVPRGTYANDKSNIMIASAIFLYGLKHESICIKDVAKEIGEPITIVRNIIHRLVKAKFMSECGTNYKIRINNSGDSFNDVLMKEYKLFGFAAEQDIEKL